MHAPEQELPKNDDSSSTSPLLTSPLHETVRLKRKTVGLTKIKKIAQNRLVWFAIGVLIVTCFLYSLSRPAPTTISAAAITEYVRVSLKPGDTLPSGLPQSGNVLGSGISGCDHQTEISWSSRSINADLTLSLSASSASEDAILRIENPDKQAGLGQVWCAGQEFEIGSTLLIKFNKANLSMTGFGAMIIGDVPNAAQNASPSLLISGRVEVYALSFPFQTGYVLTERDLMLGDSIRMVSNSRGTEDANSAFLIRAGSSKESALHVSAHANAHHVEVIRLGSGQSYALNLAPSPLARILAQSEWVLIGGLLALLSIILGWWELHQLRSMWSNSEKDGDRS